MIQIDDKIISQDLLEEHFLCDLKACKGACCVEGEYGAPLEDEELSILEKNLPKIKPFLSEEGIETIARKGSFVKGEDGEWETPLIRGRDCAYVVYDKYKIAKCGIEAAYNAGKIDFKKPISCHLYPIRLTRYNSFTAVNYHQWHICSPACDLGKTQKLKVFEFLKEAIIRKFGAQWYAKLEAASKVKQYPS